MAKGHQNTARERQWRQLIARWRRSGQTVRAFCSQWHISEPSFYAWRRALTEHERRTPPFLPVRVVADPPATTSPIELLLGNGRRLRIGPGFDADTLQQLLALLERSSC